MQPLNESADRVLGATSIARWSYGTAKAVAETLAFAHHREDGLPAIVVRLFNTVGPRQSPAYGMVIPRLVRQALANEPLTVYGDGGQSRCFCHVADVTRALVALLNCDDAVGEVFNIGSSDELTILELAHRVLGHANSSSEVTHVPYEDAYAEGFEDTRRRVPDTTKIEALLGWRPHHTLDDILRDTTADALRELRQEDDDASPGQPSDHLSHVRSLSTAPVVS